MENRIALYPVPGITQGWDDEPFDLSALPATIVPNVTVEDTSSFLNNEDAFDWLKGEMGRHDVEALRSIRYAIVHRYQPKEIDIAGESDQNAEALVRNLSACMRLIRPMRQRASFMRGVIQSDGSLQVGHFEHPNDLEVPEVQKLFVLRNRDLDHFKKVGHEFLRAMEGEFWKFRLAVQSHEAGHFSHLYWKGRFSLWCSAVEALFTSNTKDHRGSLVAKERIKWFLGATTSIYAPGDFPSSSLEVQPSITIGEVIDDLYELRNCVAHGDKTPDRFSKEKRVGLGQSVTLLEVVHEAISFIIRASLLRIIDENLLSHFANGPASESYFGGYDLTHSALKAQRAIKP